jgi:hypothetical protein
MTLSALVFSVNGGPTAYPSGAKHRANFYQSMGDTTDLPYGVRPKLCMCYTMSKNNIYKPHSGYGVVGTSAAGYLAQRNRL